MIIIHSQVGTNGYFTFDGFTGFFPFLFNENVRLSLVAPFFADIDIRRGGQIIYEVHTQSTSSALFSEINLIIEQNLQTEFSGQWLLVATWDDVPPFDVSFQTNTFQGILVTDFITSYAIFIYRCGDLNFSNGATIGFNTRDGLFANHAATLRGNARSIACQNSPVSPWVNVVYNLVSGMYILNLLGYR